MYASILFNPVPFLDRVVTLERDDDDSVVVGVYDLVEGKLRWLSVILLIHSFNLRPCSPSVYFGRAPFRRLPPQLTERTRMLHA